MSYFYVSVDSITIANDMSNDVDLAYDVFSELANLQDGDFSRFTEKLFDNIYEDENEELISFFDSIVKSFAHLKENEE